VFLALDERSYYRTHHVPQKGICADLKGKAISLDKKVGVFDIPEAGFACISGGGKTRAIHFAAEKAGVIGIERLTRNASSP